MWPAPNWFSPKMAANIVLWLIVFDCFFALTDADAICDVTPCSRTWRSIVPVFGRSSMDGVGVMRTLTSDITSESPSNSFKILSNDGIMSTCGMEYSASSSYRADKQTNTSNRLRLSILNASSWNFTSSRSSCNDSAKRLSFEPRSESISDWSDGACSEFMAIRNLFYSIYRGVRSTLQPSKSNVNISNFALLLPLLLLLFFIANQISISWCFYSFLF